MNCFLYIIEGDAVFGEKKKEVKEHNAVILGEGDELILQAGSRGVRFMLMAGHPLKEPIAWGGPIVMNTREELNLAFKELDHGTFIKTHKYE
jgi:redox-sensitive bicupin YhaK (pirin superfamily)